jgi:hypothetical protein
VGPLLLFTGPLCIPDDFQISAVKAVASSSWLWVYKRRYIDYEGYIACVNDDQGRSEYHGKGKLMMIRDVMNITGKAR